MKTATPARPAVDRPASRYPVPGVDAPQWMTCTPAKARSRVPCFRDNDKTCQRHHALPQSAPAPPATTNGCVHALNTSLGNGFLALVARVRPETVSRWASGQNTDPRPAVERRVRKAYTIYTDLVRVDSPHMVRAWSMGSKPLLGDDSPAEALAAERFKAVPAAARAFRDE